MIDPQEHILLNVHANTCAAVGEFELAKQALTQAIGLDPEDQAEILREMNATFEAGKLNEEQVE